jgi:hypothetical protein
MDALQKLDDGNLVLETPPDPRSGATSITLDPLRVDSPHHCAYSNRARILMAPTDGESSGLPAA